MGAITALGTPLPSTLNQSSYVTASFTPTAGRLLVVQVTVTDATPTSPTLTDTSASNGLTFTQVARAHKINTGTSTQEGEQYVFIADQATPGSPAAMTLTISGVTGASGCTIAMGEVASLSKVGTAAIRQSAVVSDVQGGTAPSASFGAGNNMLTGNCSAFFAHVSVGTGSTPPTNWAERADVTYATPTSGAEWSSRDSGSTATSITLGSSSNGPCSGIAVEFDTSATGFSGTAALSGAGTLAASGTPTTGDLATLSGTGSLTTATTPATAGTAALSGTGSLTTAGTPAETAPAALSGTGALTAAGTPAPTGAATLSGTGTLAATGGSGGSGTAALSGTGTLTTVTTPRPTGAATLTGDGTLTGAGSPKATGVATLTGDGALTTTGTPSGRDVAALTGEGTLTTVTVLATTTGTAALSGTGTLTASGIAHLSLPHIEFLGYHEAPDRAITYAEPDDLTYAEHTTSITYQEVTT